MKRLQYTIYLLLLLVGFVRCSNGGDLIPDPSHPTGRVTLEVSSDNPLLTMDSSGQSGEVHFKTRGGEIVFDVVSNQESWSYTASDAEWLTISADDHFLTLTAARNDSDAERIATITISAGLGGVW